jgi:hypothetical protein
LNSKCGSSLCCFFRAISKRSYSFNRLLVELIEVEATGEVVSQYKGVTDALEGRVHETRVAKVVESCRAPFCRHTKYFDKRRLALSIISESKSTINRIQKKVDGKQQEE